MFYWWKHPIKNHHLIITCAENLKPSATVPVGKRDSIKQGVHPVACAALVNTIFLY
jgi:hypothetical protein